jgi:hypothetical protein
MRFSNERLPEEQAHDDPVRDPSRLRLTEQGAFIDGYEDAGSRERGTSQLLAQVAAFLRG